MDRDLSRPINTPEFSVNVHNKSFDQELRQDFQVITEETVSKTGQEAGPETNIHLTEPVFETKFNILEKKVTAEDKDEYPVKEIEPANQPEIKTPHPKKKLPLPTDLQEVVDIIRSQGGRITQKDLRSRLKYSEGKVSLMLADLERRELIEKFKKGRENIVILKSEEC